MEIESPGGFVPPVNEKTIYHTRSARNYHLMDALRYLGYVQMAREGTRRIRESMQEYGLPEPVFKQETLHGVMVRVTLMNNHETEQPIVTLLYISVWNCGRRYRNTRLKLRHTLFEMGQFRFPKRNV